MDFITFKQFVYTINIRDCYTPQKGESIEDNSVLRLYYGNNDAKNTYIEIGWYDYYRKDTVWRILSKSLKEDVLQSVVTDFMYNTECGCMEVYLSDKKDMEETLEEYQN